LTFVAEVELSAGLGAEDIDGQIRVTLVDLRLQRGDAVVVGGLELLGPVPQSDHVAEVKQGVRQGATEHLDGHERGDGIQLVGTSGCHPAPARRGGRRCR
jgi:hypothetical protein